MSKSHLVALILEGIDESTLQPENKIHCFM